MTHFDLIYKNALEHVFTYGTDSINKRTNNLVKQCHGYSFNYAMDLLPRLRLRKTWISSAAAELAWFLSGTKDASWINANTSIWKDFTDIDGEIKTAYGYRWRYKWSYDQIENIISKLRLDNSSRQQVLLSWDPEEDNVIPKANIPCPFAYVINIINNKLNIHLTLRSNDTWLGLPYDVMTACLLGRALANSIGVSLGTLHYSVANLHLYENQFGLAQEAIDKFDSYYAKDSIEMANDNSYTINDIRLDKDKYVKYFKPLDTYNFTGWIPKINVVK